MTAWATPPRALTPPPALVDPCLPAAMSSTLVWQIVRGNNAFMRKGITGNKPVFSAEAGNLTNCHSYKASGA